MENIYTKENRYDPTYLTCAIVLKASYIVCKIVNTSCKIIIFIARLQDKTVQCKA